MFAVVRPDHDLAEGSLSDADVVIVYDPFRHPKTTLWIQTWLEPDLEPGGQRVVVVHDSTELWAAIEVAMKRECDACLGTGYRAASDGWLFPCDTCKELRR